jgi:hypothetical protein
MKEKATKFEKVAKHFLEHKQLNSWTAIVRYGATRLSAIVYRLKNEEHWDIVSEDTVVTDKNENTSKFTTYKLISTPETSALAKKLKSKSDSFQPKLFIEEKPQPKPRFVQKPLFE